MFILMFTQYTDIFKLFMAIISTSRIIIPKPSVKVYKIYYKIKKTSADVVFNRFHIVCKDMLRRIEL